jgi:hypothetical protein
MPLHYYSMNIIMVEEEKRRSTYVHTNYIHTSDMIIGCALKGLRGPQG